MGQDNQYEADIKHLSELISKYTGIPKTRTAACLKENGASELFQCSYSLEKRTYRFKNWRHCPNSYGYMKLYTIVALS